MSKLRKWTKVAAFPHRLGLTIDDELLDHLDTTAGNLGLSRAEVVRRAIRATVGDLEKEPEKEREAPPLALNQERSR